MHSVLCIKEQGFKAHGVNPVKQTDSKTQLLCLLAPHGRGQLLGVAHHDERLHLVRSNITRQATVQVSAIRSAEE